MGQVMAPILKLTGRSLRTWPDSAGGETFPDQVVNPAEQGKQGQANGYDGNGASRGEEVNSFVVDAKQHGGARN